ncbi:hypothetical protein CJ20_157 [Escherichia phage CJ20]|nr:hypothetical protein CJ20_157 [Escherichia phage CJ20]
MSFRNELFFKHFVVLLLRYTFIYNVFKASARAIKASSALVSASAVCDSVICFGLTQASGALGPHTASTPTVNLKPSLTML